VASRFPSVRRKLVRALASASLRRRLGIGVVGRKAFGFFSQAKSHSGPVTLLATWLRSGAKSRSTCAKKVLGFASPSGPRSWWQA